MRLNCRSTRTRNCTRPLRGACCVPVSFNVRSHFSMLLFFIWALGATSWLAFVAAPGLLAAGLSGDASIVFWLISMIGLPGWLIVAGLTVARWRSTPKAKVAWMNGPGVLAAIIYAAVQLQWAAK
jgi:hypothetical protein